MPVVKDEKGNVVSRQSYTPEGESAMKFVCEEWTKEIPYNNRGFIKATFRQVFEP